MTTTQPERRETLTMATSRCAEMPRVRISVHTQCTRTSHMSRSEAGLLTTTQQRRAGRSLRDTLRGAATTDSRSPGDPSIAGRDHRVTTAGPDLHRCGAYRICNPRTRGAR